jgi:glycerophosphoryl diester phosphodiesterase
LKEVLDLIGRRCKVNIEIKGHGIVPKVYAEVLERFAAGWGRQDLLFSSFNHLDLWHLKEFDPALRLAPLAAMLTEGFAEFAIELGAKAVSLDFQCLSQGFVRQAHEKELAVYAYTVDEPSDIARVKDMGVDGIFSNFPDRV